MNQKKNFDNNYSNQGLDLEKPKIQMRNKDIKTRQLQPWSSSHIKARNQEKWSEFQRTKATHVKRKKDFFFMKPRKWT